MSKALSLDLRSRVLAAVAAGASHRQAAARFGVSAASVSRWRTRARQLGDARPKALGGDRRSARIEAPGGVDPPRCRRDARHHHRRAAPGARRATATASATAPSSASSPVTASRVKKDRPRQRAGPPGHPEAAPGLVRRPARPRPRAPRLHRRDLGDDQHGADAMAAAGAASGCAWASPHGHWKTTTFVAALTLRGFIAPFVLDGADQPRRLRDLCRSRSSSRNSVPATSSSWTTSRATRVRKIRALIEAAGASLLLPAALQPRLQPDRERLRQAQGPAPQGRRAHRRRPMDHHRPPRRPLHPRRMRQLLPRLRLRCNLIGLRSSGDLCAGLIFALMTKR